jgi:hypothetical protein
MIRQKVNSSNLFAIGYDEGTQILEVEFNNGTVYQYFNVPKVIYLALMNSASHGKYFSQNVRTNYRYERIV